MRLFNTLSQRIEPLDPVGDAVTLYVCGITPYDTTHLGHAFINVIYDSLVRYLRWRGLSVRYVQNVTDIDDDILRKSAALGMSWDALGKQETERYLSDLHALNVAVPDVYVSASDETAKMIELIEALIAQGHAYVRDGWVYFSVKSDPGFGKLADAGGYVGYDAWLETANERGNYPDDPRKDDPLDFVLWQAQQPGEPAWPSPWGPGRPGWHIECSAMAVKYLGPRVDIHGGGSDLVFPHHTCEIAQSENATGQRPFVKVWMHCGMTRLDDEKMSKSLGNLILVRNLLPTYSADAVRLLLLSHYYRESWEYTEEEVRACQSLADQLTASAAACHEDVRTEGTDAASRQSRLEFIAALEDDFHTEKAIHTLVALSERARNESSTEAAGLLCELAGVLGLRLGARTHAISRGAVGASEA